MTHEFNRAAAVLAEEFVRRHPAEAAAELEGLPPDHLVEILGAQSVDDAVALLESLRPEVSAEVIVQSGDQDRKDWLSAMNPSRTAIVLSRLDEGIRAEILSGLRARVASEVADIMSYPPDTAGALMDPQVSHFRAFASAEAALAQLRGLRHLRISNLHVVDNQGVFLGSVRIQDLALAEPGQELRELILTAPASVQAMAPRTDVVELLEKGGLLSLPVVDFDGHLVGVIRYDALLSAVESEATVDIQTMVGASRDERALSPVRFAVASGCRGCRSTCSPPFSHPSSSASSRTRLRSSPPWPCFCRW